MPKSSLSYPKVRKDKSGKYFIDLTLNDKRYRLYSGKIIKSSLRPNSYPAKYRLSKAKILADEVYKYLVSNDYCFGKKPNRAETFDRHFYAVPFELIHPNVLQTTEGNGSTE